MRLLCAAYRPPSMGAAVPFPEPVPMLNFLKSLAGGGNFRTFARVFVKIHPTMDGKQIWVLVLKTLSYIITALLGALGSAQF